MNNNYIQVASPRQWQRSFPISLALIRTTTNNHSRTSKFTEEILEHGGKHPRYHRYQERLHSCRLKCPSPGPAQHHVMESTSGGFTSSRGKREPRRDNQHCHPQHCVSLWVCECHYSELASWECRRICRAQLVGLWLWWGKGERLATTSTWSLAEFIYQLPK